MKIIGIDICRSHGVAWPLTVLPDKPRQHFRDRNTTDTEQIPYNLDGVTRLLSKAPTAIVLEPTGLHYARLLAETARANGIAVLWVAHSAVKATRKAYLLPNKNDQADAFVLAMYGLRHWGDSSYFLSLDLECPSLQLRDSLFQCQFLSRQRTRLQNRIRQSLAHECPEVMLVKGDREGLRVPVFWQALAGMNPKYNRHEKTIENTVGTGVSYFTRSLAAQVVSVIQLEIELDKQIELLSRSQQFDRYHAAFDHFAFGERTRAALLAFIYPLEQFMGANGRPIIERVMGSHGKPTKRNRSLSAFKLTLGIGLVEDSSGNSSKWIPGGSELCRRSLWLWAFTRVEIKRNRCTPTLEELGKRIDQLKAGGVPSQLARSRVCGIAVRRLWATLLGE